MGCIELCFLGLTNQINENVTNKNFVRWKFMSMGYIVLLRGILMRSGNLRRICDIVRKHGCDNYYKL